MERAIEIEWPVRAASERRAGFGLLPPVRARVALATILVLALTLVGTLLRLVLYAAFHEGAFEPAVLARCLAVGLARDGCVALVVAAPFLAGACLFRWAWLARPRLRFAFLTACGAASVFLALVEYFFFEEFDARFNNIAVDYVLFPGEVAGNLWQSYDVPLHLGVALLGGLALAVGAQRFLAGARFEPLPWRARLGLLGLLGLGSGGALAGIALLPRELGTDRVANEIAGNGLVELVRSVWTADLEVPLYYRTLPDDQARVRAARVLGFPESDPRGPDFALEKPFPAAPGAHTPSQIVIVLEESLGSDFVGAFPGSRADCTPELERHFADGLVLTNLIANGNRTVRGLEGVLCSFVPLPGYAILRRGKSENVATVARVLGARGYHTVFFYGGSSTFDQMGSFARDNGWQEWVDGDSLPKDAMRTAWGAADEYVFDALLARQEEASRKRQRFFATLLTVSNHKPYDFPRGRYAIPGELTGRKGAVRYADACIGGYLDGLRERGLADDTLVLIVGDHGARVYGAEEIPTHSYRIPALFVTPDPAWHGRRIERLCSQIDLVPTLLALAGIECTAPFLGESVLGLPAAGGRAFVQHNREVGILGDRGLAVLGLGKTVSLYTRPDTTSDAFTPVAEDGAPSELRSLADDASAVFGCAYALYEDRRFRLPGDLEPRVASTPGPLVHTP